MEEEIKEDVKTEEVKEHSLIEKANNAAERTEKAVEELRKERILMEEAAAQLRLGGTSAGNANSSEKKELTAAEYIKAATSGNLPTDEK